MERYPTEFYEPILHDYSNYGTWVENGKLDANHRATSIWKEIVSKETTVNIDKEKLGHLENFIYKRTTEGGAFPVN